MSISNYNEDAANKRMDIIGRNGNEGTHYFNSKFDSYEWVCNVINSCKTSKHIENTIKLIVNFDKMYQDRRLKVILLRKINNLNR
tara:strand:+ start:322 stop:576 length:255 start_codon:yes stop_codon:yes gene_type:complete